MNIQEVSEILGLTRALIAPQHVFITDEPVTAKLNGQASFRGLQPIAKKGVILMSKHADETTPVHETIHENFGFGELATVPLTSIIHKKVQFIRKFPRLAKMLRKPIKYREVHESSEFPEAHNTKYGKRIRHFVRVV